jgi:hypothetical protein
MNTRLQKLIANWKPRIEANQKAQGANAKRLTRYHYAIGLPATILATLAGATLLTEINDPTIRAIVGATGLIAAVLSAVQTFYSFAKRAEEHRATSIRLGDIRRDLEILEQYPPASRIAEEEHVRKISAQLSKIGETSPSIDDDDIPYR